MDLFLTNMHIFPSQGWTEAVWIIVMFSCLDSHSDGTHSLQRIHWWASDVMLKFSKSVLMKTQTHLSEGTFSTKKLINKIKKERKKFKK